MKVMLPRHWDRHINCIECKSYLRIEEGDLRMTADFRIHVVCEVCDSKNEVLDVPEYLSRKLKKLLTEKSH